VGEIGREVPRIRPAQRPRRLALARLLWRASSLARRHLLRRAELVRRTEGMAAATADLLNPKLASLDVPPAWNQWPIRGLRIFPQIGDDLSNLPLARGRFRTALADRPFEGQRLGPEVGHLGPRPERLGIGDPLDEELGGGLLLQVGERGADLRKIPERVDRVAGVAADLAR